MSLDDVKFSLPEMAGLTGRVTQIVSARKTAEASAQRQEAIASEDARLRRMQAARLLGAQRASFAARGVEGGSAGAIQRETVQLEALDVGRILTRSSLLAQELRNRGLAQGIASTLGIPQDAAFFGAQLRQREELEQRKKSTLLPSTPTVDLG